MVAGIVFGLLGLGRASFLLFRLMVHALPTLSAGLLAFNTGAGAISATTVALRSVPHRGLVAGPDFR